MEARASNLVEALEGHIQELELPLKVVQFGSLMWMHGSEKKEPQKLSEISPHQQELFKQLFFHCLDEGLYLAPNGYEVSFLSFAHDEKILVECSHRFKNAFTRLKETLDS
jgi:glutamate-1-semialdehyde 2,1-aminomutase